ncbi:hypothetical protein [Rhodanobacter sp. ANJX3]|uniref:hypothetical protein n=1 Tax=Rhodanobacter sp. ANJX3 TaxID=2723083 RepID=UPI001C85EA74|nr:hypothetical protein [Rhodanobacter sp. ANJX3]
MLKTTVWNPDWRQCGMAPREDGGTRALYRGIALRETLQRLMKLRGHPYDPALQHRSTPSN